MIDILKRETWFELADLPLSVERRDPQLPFGLHKHEFSELVVITGGTGIHVTDQDSWKLQKGDVFVVDEDQPHDYHNLEDLRLVNVLFDRELLTSDLRDLPLISGYLAMFSFEPNCRQRHQFGSHLTLSPRELTRVLPIIDSLERELEHQQIGFKCSAIAYFHQLVVMLSRCYGEVEKESSRSLLRIAETISFLEANYAEEIQVDMLVDISGMSRRSFLRAFEEATGSTPIAYLIRLRLNRSAELLRSTAKSITDIAFDVGFNDSNYFSRQFRKCFDVSPREYRNDRY